jgi:hypothetical protein
MIMNLSTLCLIVTKTDELKSASEFMKEHRCSTLLITPEIINEAAMTRTMLQGGWKIYVMVDYPRGQRYGMDKFKGTVTEFFLSDGYDIILTCEGSTSNTIKEIRSVTSFIREMINPMADIIMTVNRSMRGDEEFGACIDACRETRVNYIKTEAQPKIQPSSASLEVHKNTIESIRTRCQTPVIVCGNVNFKIYDGLMAQSVKFAMCLDQAIRLKAEIDRRPDIYDELVAKYPKADLEKCKKCSQLSSTAMSKLECNDAKCPGTEFAINDGLIVRR